MCRCCCASCGSGATAAAALEAVQLPPSPYEEAERALDLFRNDTDEADLEDLGAE
ncbi:MAG TPA: hypothetical protein VNF74_03185 [Terriglobales bacterium]|nr:hypothetical protein [Terriglobales bacterium]